MKNPPPLKRKKIGKLKALILSKSKEFKSACISFNKVKKAKQGGHFNGFDSPELREHLWFYKETQVDCRRALRRLKIRLQQELLMGNV